MFHAATHGEPTGFVRDFKTFRSGQVYSMFGPRTLYAALLAALLSFGSGCSDTPAPPPWPKLDPEGAAKAALEQYDANHDGKLDAKELANCPPLQAMLATLKSKDSSHADWLRSEDIAGRIRDWLNGGAILMGGTTVVRLDDHPLAAQGHARA